MERWQKILIAVLSAAVVALGAFSFGYSVAGGRDRIFVGDGSGGGDLSLIEDVYGKIKSESVDPPSDEELVRGAVKGMAKTVKSSGDDFALFYSPKAYRSFQEVTTGQFSGIGVWLKDREGRLEIVSVIPSTPAQRAGLQSGDVIDAIDGESVGSLNSDEAVNRIKGKEGSDVNLGIQRDGEAINFDITRETIELPNLLANRTPEGLGYVRLFGFSRGAGDQLRDEVKKLTDEGAEGIILDLRDNGGGLFSEGVSVASVFIEEGEIVSYKERSDPEVSYDAEGDAFEDVPLVVLVNEGTASASEIVTGALQDTNRAVVVGKTTYGKGSVQEVLPLSDASALKLTIGAYFTPDGTQINGTGIEPDVEVDADPETQKERAKEILQGIIISGNGSQG
ncbi:MAG: S41 family peptidase [Actinomycetota bacterium]|nr:S41 family peptidase [Actinomycetota bacterium]